MAELVDVLSFALGIGAPILGVVVLLRLLLWLVERGLVLYAAHRERMLCLQERATALRYVRVEGFPFALVDVEAGTLAQPFAELVAQRLATQRPAQPVPQTITFSPHYAPNLRHSQEGAALAPPPTQMARDAPTFAELLERGSLGNGRFLLGCDLTSGQAITGGWKELYSTALGGLSGTGKSTTARFLLSQAALNGCKFVVLDPHAGAGEDSLAATLTPLAGAMVCAAVSRDEQILEAVQSVAGMGRKRLAGDGERAPVIVCIDEATALLARSSVGEQLGELIELIAQEFRKVNIFALCSAQIRIAARSGGSSALRDSFASAYVHRMKRNQARLLLPTEKAKLVETLSTGQAVLWRTSGETQTIVIPNTTMQDVQQVAQRLGGQPGVDAAYGAADKLASAPAGGTPVVSNCPKIRSLLSGIRDWVLHPVIANPEYQIPRLFLDRR